MEAIKARSIRCVGMCNVREILAEKLAGNRTLEDVGAYDRIILNWILKE
jgi:hypothetical protein